MNDFEIITDTGCDISPSILADWSVTALPLEFDFQNTDFDKNSDITAFYNCMRDGGIAKTTAINPDTFINAFEKFLRNGKDVLYISFSSGLSTTYNSACIAVSELADKYPERKVVIVDSLAASAGQGLLVYLTAQKANSGADIDQTAAYAEQIKLNICHWFTVDDLVYLKRGGRISSATAFFGGVLHIKPILHVDDEGHLVSVSKARGRSASVRGIAEQYSKLAQDLSGGTVFISHGDCLSEAEKLANILRDKHGVDAKIITDIGPVIGAHSGPGTLALFFVGHKR